MLGDDLVARDLAATAGELLMGLREAGGAASAEAVIPADAAAELRRQGDLQSHRLLASRLGQLRPEDAVLSEEAADNPARLSAERVWIIDPLDGTREFGEPGRTDWAVHVALWQRGHLTAGAVALPALGTVLSTADLSTAGLSTAGLSTAGLSTAGLSTGATPRREAGAGAADTGFRLVVSRSRPPEFVPRVAASLGAELIQMGSAGAKAAAVICGQADAYIHAGGQYEWDSAAPVAVALAAGLHASRLDGSDLHYNQPDPSLPDILICPAEFASQLLQAVRDSVAQGAGSGGPP